MGHLLPQLPGCPSDAVLSVVVLSDVAPAIASALGAEQLFQPFVAEHQHRIGLDHQLGGFIAHPPHLELLRCEQMQEIFFAVAFDSLLQVGRAEQFPPLRALPAPASGSVG